MITENEIQEMNQKESQLLNKTNQIYAKLNSLAAAQNTEKAAGRRLEDRHVEKGYYRNFPVSEEEDPSFKDKFLALTRGLDKESIRQVTQIIRRLQILKSQEGTLLPEFTQEEMEKLSFMEEHFEKEVLRLSKDCYYYNGYMLPTPRFEACVFVDGCGVKDIENPGRFADKDIIDAGAYIGDSALLFSELTSGKVYAFEPTAKNYQDMLKTIEMNGLDRVVPCKYALGDKKGTAEMTNAVVSATNAYVDKSTMPYLATETVDVVTLDDFVKENDLHVGLIKTDVEGAEQMLLAGAMETIRTQKPTLLISIYHNASDFYTIKPMLESLGLGYRFKIRHPVIGTVLMETMLIAEADD
jgi:FkbM family methyltransferase